MPMEMMDGMELISDVEGISGIMGPGSPIKPLSNVMIDISNSKY